MPPSPEPTAAQVVTVLEIMGENDYALVSGLVTAGSGYEADAKWAATLDDIDEWESEVRGNYVALRGKVELDPELPEAKIRARVRGRYGLTTRVSAEVTGEDAGLYESCAVQVEAW